MPRLPLTCLAVVLLWSLGLSQAAADGGREDRGPVAYELRLIDPYLGDTYLGGVLVDEAMLTVDGEWADVTLDQVWVSFGLIGAVAHAVVADVWIENGELVGIATRIYSVQGGSLGEHAPALELDGDPRAWGLYGATMDLAGGYTIRPADTGSCSVGQGRPNGECGSECIYCSPGSVSLASDFCEPCPAGSREEASALCRVCEPGSYQNMRGATSCDSCSAGTYQDSWGATACNVCEPGHFQDAEGGSACQPCSAGSVQPAAGSLGCDACQPGSYQSETGATACLPCPAGTHQSDAGASACVPCVAGFYQDELGATACQPCPEGMVQSLVGQMQCTYCQEGQVPSEDRQHCEPISGAPGRDEESPSGNEGNACLDEIGLDCTEEELMELTW